MESFVNLLNAYALEYASLQSSVHSFRQSIQQQKDEDNAMLQKIAVDRDFALDAAFLSLEHLTEELLAIEDGESLVGSYALPSLPKTVSLFHQLSKTCESAVDRIGEEFVDTTQYGGENRQLKAKLADYNIRISSDIQGCKAYLAMVVQQRITHDQTVRVAEEELQKSRDKQSGIFYDLFGDDDIDIQVRSNRQVLVNAQTIRDSVQETAYQLLRIQQACEELLEKVRSLQSDIDCFFHEMNAEYSKLVDGRRRDEHCWSTTRMLDYHVSTSGPNTSRDDVLRHIIQLVNSLDDEIDADKDVQLSKSKIKALMLRKLGDGEYGKLELEKRYLKTESDDF